MSNNLTTVAAPVPQSERIVILDSLRGIAILGILLMNIPGFGLPSPAAYGDLSVLNEMGTINYKVWLGIELSVAGSQRALFSMLFGAGMILFLANKEKKSDGLMPAEYYFRRQLWLLVFGLFNAFVLLWFWDILFHYAFCGMILFAFRRLSPKALIIAAIVCLGFQTVRDNVSFYRDKKVIATGEMIAKMDTTISKLTDDQKSELGAMTEIKEKSSAEGRKKDMEKSLRKVRGDYASFYKYQSERSFHSEIEYLYFGIWDILIFMFLGMAFYKNGVLLGNASSKVYWLMALGGLAAGIFLTWYRLKPVIDLNFNNYEIIKQTRFELYEVARTIRSVGVFAVIMLLYKSGWFKWLFAMMRPVGQMAFTNYLMQSLLVGLFFYGVGFGMFGKLERYEIYYVVAATWTLQIIYSHIWLSYFRFGPLEWAWRSLTYWKMQPFRKNNSAKDMMGVV
jgi:uncharacterized protein